VITLGLVNFSLHFSPMAKHTIHDQLGHVNNILSHLSWLYSRSGRKRCWNYCPRYRQTDAQKTTKAAFDGELSRTVFLCLSPENRIIIPTCYAKCKARRAIRCKGGSRTAPTYCLTFSASDRAARYALLLEFTHEAHFWYSARGL